MDSARQRLLSALDSPAPAPAVEELARALRREGMSQLVMYRLFAEQQQRLAGDDPRYDAIVDTMDLIYGGPWAKGRALFDTVLTSAHLNEE